jgi:hypothetical protein
MNIFSNNLSNDSSNTDKKLFTWHNWVSIKFHDRVFGYLEYYDSRIRNYKRVNEGGMFTTKTFARMFLLLFPATFLMTSLRYVLASMLSQIYPLLGSYFCIPFLFIIRKGVFFHEA